MVISLTVLVSVVLCSCSAWLFTDVVARVLTSHMSHSWFSSLSVCVRHLDGNKAVL
jgi:hypothetical protein